jgi:hypothetical protein
MYIGLGVKCGGGVDRYVCVYLGRSVSEWVGDDALDLQVEDEKRAGPPSPSFRLPVGGLSVGEWGRTIDSP